MVLGPRRRGGGGLWAVKSVLAGSGGRGEPFQLCEPPTGSPGPRHSGHPVFPGSLRRANPRDQNRGEAVSGARNAGAVLRGLGLEA
ncbi:MAG: hypothetical protein ACE5R6_16170 [Candidatus Heimdallarchaeota archaeon]